MILNPQAVLSELAKYEKIVNLARRAFDRLSKGEPVDDLRDILKIRLDECGFTQMTGPGTASTPLHSVTSYIDKPDLLKSQIAEAEGFIQTMIAKIKTEVGPFYSKDEVMSFKEMGDRTLEGHVWLPTMETITVKTYLDSDNKIAIQADWQHGQYRTAEDGGGEYGPWKFFTK